MTTRSEAYGESLDLLLALDELMRLGQGDSDEADGLRDRMDEPWELMSPGERTRIRALSADLYTLWVPPHVTRPVTAESRELFIRLREEGRWLELLSLLHEQPALCSPDEASRLRLDAWSALDEPAIALKFAAQLLSKPSANLPSLRRADPGRHNLRSRATEGAHRSLPTLRRIEHRP